MSGENLEALMIICFGASWPISIYKSYKTRSTKGKSWQFLSLVIIGYGCGILSKFFLHEITYVLFFYILNFFMVSADLCLYFRNKRLDRLAAADAGPRGDAE